MSACSRCGAEFICGLIDAADGQSCWCMIVPTTAKENVAFNADGSMQSCMCPGCLLEPQPKAIQNPG